jgi:hypothetical protein
MKRLHRLDFMAPASRPWAGYVLLLLAVLTTAGVFELLWRTRTATATVPEAGLAAAAARTGPLPALSATPPAAATFAGRTGLSGTADAAAALDADTSGTDTAPTAQSDAAAGVDRLQVGQTRSLAGAQALPWARLLATLQAHAGDRIELLRIEPAGRAERPPLSTAVHVLAQARSNADIDAFMRALRAEVLLRDVSLTASPSPASSPPRARSGANAARRPVADDPGWLQFEAVASWRAPTARPPTDARADSSAGPATATSATSTQP